MDEASDDDGYDAVFVDEVAELYKCVVCHFVLRDPVLLVECGHRLCAGCFRRIKDDATDRNIELLCPYDRIKVEKEQVVSDKGVARSVLDLKVKCDNNEEGCQWTGELRNLKAHLDQVCGYQEKKNTFQLITHLMERIERCEEDSKCYRDSLEEKEKQIKDLQKDLKSCKEKLDRRKTRIELIEKELREMRNNRHETNIASNSSDTETVKHGNQQQDQSKKEWNKNIERRFISLENHILNVKEYNQNDDYVVFEWRLENFYEHRDSCEDVYSPIFYSRPSGPSFKLNLEWYGNKLGRLGVFLCACKDIWNATPPVCFNLFYIFESWNKYGESKRSEGQQDADCFDIDFDEEESSGWGDDNFLSMPSLRNYIVDNSFTVKCTLYMRTLEA